MSEVMEPEQPLSRSLQEEMAAKLRRERKSRGMTLQDIAKKIGTTPQTVQRLETASMTLSTLWVDKLCAALEMDPRLLFSEKPQFNRREAIEAMASIDVIMDDLKHLRERLGRLVKGRS
jgi:transcriptional regulator with XRE-family HTH domain